MNWVELGGDGDGVSHAPTDPVVLRLRRYVSDSHGQVVPHADLGTAGDVAMIATEWAYGFLIGVFLGGTCGFLVAALLRMAHRNEER